MASNGVGRPAEAKIHVHVKCECGEHSLFCTCENEGMGNRVLRCSSVVRCHERGGGAFSKRRRPTLPPLIFLSLFSAAVPEREKKGKREGGSNIRTATHIPTHSPFPRPNRRFPRRGKKKCSPFFPTSSSHSPPLRPPPWRNILLRLHIEKKRKDRA